MRGIELASLSEHMRRTAKRNERRAKNERSAENKPGIVKAAEESTDKVNQDETKKVSNPSSKPLPTPVLKERTPLPLPKPSPKPMPKERTPLPAPIKLKQVIG